MRIALVGAEIEENLALRYIAAALEAAGHEVAVFDFHNEKQVPDLTRKITTGRFEILGLSMIFTARSWEFLGLAARCREAGFEGHITSGGHFAALHAARLIEDYPALDTVIHGEGEEPMVELTQHLDRPELVSGLTYRDSSGRPRSTGPRPNPDDLDSRPWPSRPEQLHRYLGKPIANLLSSRGCYASCAFCSIHAYHCLSGGKRFRQRNIEAVAEEMAALYHDRGVRIFNFQDDNFLVPRKKKNLDRANRLKAALANHGVGQIAIQAKARPDCIDEEVIELLKSMGLFRLFLGVETDAAVSLITLGRGMELEDNHRALEILRRQEIHTCFNLLMFEPDCTLETIRTNVDFMGRQDYFPLNFCRVEVYGGTPIHDRLAEQGRLLGGYLAYTYRIAEPRSQRAYELFRSVFWSRNFDFDGTHFGSMKLDYNLHLLQHFYPERTSPALFDAAKEVLAELNAHSAELMHRVLDFCASDDFEDDTAAEALRRELDEERAAVDEPLKQRMHALVAHMEALAALDPLPGRRRFLHAAVGAAAAATLATVAPGCGSGQSGGGFGDTHMCEAPPPPEPPPELTPQQLTELQAAVQQRVDHVLWPRIRQSFPAGVALVLRVYLGANGTIQHCRQDSSGAPEGLTEAICQDLGSAQLQLPSFSQMYGAYGPYEAHIHLSWRPSPDLMGPERIDLRNNDQFDDTHMCEAPPPPEQRILPQPRNKSKS